MCVTGALHPALDLKRGAGGRILLCGVMQLVDPRAERLGPGEPVRGVLDDELKQVHADRKIRGCETGDGRAWGARAQFRFMRAPSGGANHRVDTARGEKWQR